VTGGQARDVDDNIVGIDPSFPSMHLDLFPLVISSPSNSPQASDYVIHKPSPTKEKMEVHGYYVYGCKFKYDYVSIHGNECFLSASLNGIHPCVCSQGGKYGFVFHSCHS